MMSVRVVAGLGALLVLAFAGCGGDGKDGGDTSVAAGDAKPAATAGSDAESAGPWVAKTSGSVSSSPGANFTLKANGSDFFTVVESLCNNYEVTCVVKPKSLVDEGIAIEIAGTSAEETFADLAEKAGLSIEKTGDAEWTIVRPGSEDAESETVRMQSF